MLGGLAAYAAVDPPVPEPERLIVPWSTAWQDKWGINPVIAEGMFTERESDRTECVLTRRLMYSCGESNPMGKAGDRRYVDAFRARSVLRPFVVLVHSRSAREYVAELQLHSWTGGLHTTTVPLQTYG